MKYYSKWAKREYSLSQRLLGMIPVGILFLFLIPYTLIVLLPRLDITLGLPSFFFGIANFLVGGLFILVGAAYAFWSIVSQFVLARGTPLPVMATQSLIVSGPFKQCRNPMAFGTILLYTGVGIVVGSISSVVVVFILSALLLLYIKRIEERELEARFGQAYLEYRSATPFLIPRIFSRNRPT